MTTILILGVVGIAALLAEIVLPGGLLGAIGALCLLGAVVATYVEFGTAAGTVALAAFVAVGLGALAGWMRLFHRLPFTRSLVLHDTAGDIHPEGSGDSLVGREGTALTALMPSGRAEIGGEKRDVVAEGPAIAKGAKIVVVAVRGPSVVVRELA